MAPAPWTGQLISASLGNWNTSWNTSASCSTSPRITSKWYLSNASTFTGYSLHSHGDPNSSRAATPDPKLALLHTLNALNSLPSISLNSSQSQRIEFTYLSKPLKDPMKINHPARRISPVVNVRQHLAPLSQSHDCCSTNFHVHRTVSGSTRPKKAYGLRYDAGSPTTTPQAGAEASIVEASFVLICFLLVSATWLF